MGRAYLILIVFAGLFSAMASNLSAPRSVAASSSANSSDSRLVEAATSSERSGRGGQVIKTGSGEAVIERSADGHFYADVEINGATVRAMVDTGASRVALSREDARSAGVALSIGMNEVIGRGADGEVRGEYVTLDRVSLGSTSVERLRAIVLSSGEQSLLGQNFLSRFASVQIEGDRMILR